MWTTKRRLRRQLAEREKQAADMAVKAARADTDRRVYAKGYDDVLSRVTVAESVAERLGREREALAQAIQLHRESFRRTPGLASEVDRHLWAVLDG